MFAYCENNPVMRSDPTGEFAIPVVEVAAIVIGGATNVISSAVAATANGEDYSLINGIFDFASGALGAVTKKGFGCISALVAGIGAGYDAYNSGSTLGAAFLCGVISAGASFLSVSGLFNGKQLTKEIIATINICDLTFGTAIACFEEKSNITITQKHKRPYKPTSEQISRWNKMTEYYKRQLVS